MAESSTPVNDEQQLWWSGWLQTAKEKSSVALEFMKKDLAEFGQTVQHDAVSAISATSSVVKQTLRLDDKDSVASQTKEGLQTLFGKISEAFYPGFEKDEDEVVVIRDSEPITVEKWHAHLHYIQTHPSNYSHKPNGSTEDYQKWLENFSLEERQKEISDVLVGFSDVRTLYTGMVPSILSNLEFWQRFFYRIFQANEIQARRTKLMKRAEKGDIVDEVSWEDDEITRQESETEIQSEKMEVSLSKDDASTANGAGEKPEVIDTKVEIAETPSSSSLIDDTVIVNSSPSSSDTNASQKTSTEDEWEKDFDLEETNLSQKASKTSVTGTEDEWENWE